MNSEPNKQLGLKDLVIATGKITSRLDIESVLGQIVDTLTKDLDGVSATVWLIEDGDICGSCNVSIQCRIKGRCLHLKACSGQGGPDVFMKRVPLGVMDVGTIALSKSPHIDNDVIDDPIIVDKDWFSKTRVRSFAGFPLLHCDELLGVMAYFGDRPLSSELGDMLLCLAHQSSMAVVDAKHHMQVRESEQRYKTLIDGAIDAVFILGPDGSILKASRSATRQFGFTKEEFADMNFKDLDPISFDALLDAYPELLAGETITYSAKYITKHGGPLPVEVKAGSTVYKGDTAIQAFVRDMTDRVRMEKDRADVVSMVTHDLKGPLSVVIGYSEIIKWEYWDALPEDVREGIESIHANGKKILSMVEDFLSLSRMESGALTMRRLPVNIVQLIGRALETAAFEADKKGQKLTSSCYKDMPDIAVDPKYMERAVTNLLLNAVNYTPRGGSITVTAGLSEGGTVVEIAVADTGVGIPDDELDRVFDKYYRAPGNGGNGTGLGLAIVKSIAEGHGGRVGVESVKDEGSVFTITLPVILM